MSARIRDYVRQHHVGLLALFLVVSGGTAYALDGENTVDSGDIINNEVRSADVRDDTKANGGLLPQDLAAGSVGRSELDPAAFAALDISRDTPTSAFEIPGNAIQSSEVSDESLTGADVNEATLTVLDGHDSFDANCDPGNETYIVCDELSFTLGRDMEVSATWVYGFGTDGDVNPNGECRTTLNGAPKSNSIWLSSEDDSDFSIGGVPVVDVMALTAGTHTVGLECHEHQPDGKDLVVREIGISVVELGFD